MKRVNLHIGHLVLRGFQHEDRHSIAQGIQHELSRIFSDPESAQQLSAHSNVSRLRIGNVQISQDAKPQSVGTKVAQGIGKGMKR